MASASPIHIWMFCGYAGSGKTHAARHLQSLLNPDTTYVTAFADAVKDDVAAMYKLPRTLFDTQEGKASLVNTPDGERTARDLLIDYSLAMKEAYGDAVWAEEVVRRIHTITQNRRIEHVIIHDLRFKSEVETIYNQFGDSPMDDFALHTIRIVRPSVRSLPIPSEHDLDEYTADICIENSGSVDELHGKISQVMEIIRGVQ